MPRYIAEHRFIVEQAIERKLVSNEIIHHLNGNSEDNRKCNLMVCDRSYHRFIHNKMDKMQANWSGLT